MEKLINIASVTYLEHSKTILRTYHLLSLPVGVVIFYINLLKTLSILDFRVYSPN